MSNRQRGGTILGLILGVMIGLGAALAVAVYVTQVPVPFLNKGQTRSADQDAAEVRKNQNWDPNAPMYGRNPARPAPAGAAAGIVQAPSATASAGRPVAVASAPAKVETRVPPAGSSDPLGDLAKARAAAVAAPSGAAIAANPAAVASVDPFDYFVQAGAFRSQSDAEAQRAKLAIMGWEAKVSERDQAGRVVYRVRVGPFSKRDDAEQLKEKIDGSGTESALVRVQR